ncbi:MAG: DUF924 domain-containing protein [Burkholderiales bacterium]|nr:DUF924 domain-containing protein [Burkholderiales bacterium]
MQSRRPVTATDEIGEVLEFWFGDCGPDGSLDAAKRRMWFGDGRGHDAGIRERFGALHARAARGDLVPDWAPAPRGRLALIVVLDQFSRHIHRGAPAAFAQDPAAQHLAADAVEKGIDRALFPAARAFLYLPFEHAEDLALQRLSVACFERLCDEVSPGWRGDYEGFLDYARRHHDVIARFGRFPHRNAALGRETTPEETAFLGEPGSSF